MTRQFILEIGPKPEPALGNFVAGGNGELLAALRGLLNGLVPERFLHLWGPAGCGKTHLLRAFVAEAAAGGWRVAYHSSGDALPDLDDENAWVAVDDVQRLPEHQQQRLFHLHNRLRGGAGVLLTASDRPPAGLALRPDLRTRLGWGLVYEVQVLGDDEKLAALQARGREFGFDLPLDAARYLLRHGRRDMPSLLALLAVLDRRSMEMRRPVSLALLRELMQDEEG